MHVRPLRCTPYTECTFEPRHALINFIINNKSDMIAYFNTKNLCAVVLRGRARARACPCNKLMLTEVPTQCLH